MTHTAWIFINHHYCSSHFCWDAQDQLQSSRLHQKTNSHDQIRFPNLLAASASTFKLSFCRPQSTNLHQNFGTLWGDSRCHSSQNAPSEHHKDMKRWLESSTCSSERNSFLPIHKYWAIIRKTPIPTTKTLILATTPPLFFGGWYPTWPKIAKKIPQGEARWSGAARHASRLTNCSRVALWQWELLHLKGGVSN